MEWYLFVFGIILVLFGYGMFFWDMVKYARIYKEEIGFDRAKENTLDYNHINIVESGNSFISHYSFDRKVIRMTKRMYYSKDLFSLAMASYLSGISMENTIYTKYYGLLFKRIDFFNKSSILMVILSYFIHTVGDAKIGLIIGIFIIIYQYFYLQICSSSMEGIKIKDDEKVIFHHLYYMNLILFVSSLVFILRMILYII